jgi:hypothetical protein
MQRFIPRLITVTLLLTIPVLLGGGNAAEAKDNHNQFLRGDFPFTAFRACVQTGMSPGFAADLSLLGPASYRTTVLAGTLSYNGDGTGTAVYRFLNMFFANTMTGNLPVGGGETMCTIGNIVVHSDRSFTQDMTCSGEGDIGAGAGGAFSITGIKWDVRISRNRKVLTLHLNSADVETLTAGAMPTDRDRICEISGTALQDRRGRGGEKEEED